MNSDRIKEQNAWLRAMFTVLSVLDAPLIVWVYNRLASMTLATATVAIIVALMLSAAIICVLVIAARLLRQMEK